ncbi:Anthranilate synthase component II protein [Halorhabdus tiamatea SARL4B]|uniref:Anthranilate synthase component II n=1 Tax=Halorhabdus tiamatea SARL4B TaxID=1033806 RepID=F7PFH1_9EURY|nr:aminodeoxychorismate/anthranilate synthase component II [Halorhabdus tiamatea]ERJ06467.1 Anthranilate synthase component II protein [Halorhabdus tiamatea SARL4B]CCQ34368.1 para-aminobenzoate synthase, component II [Halorhabdus tiamatea SARL4B]
MTGPILVVDNYDSFAYNLVQYVGTALSSGVSPHLRPADPREAVVVRRNDEIDAAGIRDLDPAGIVVSPGPGTPADAGVSKAVFELNYPAFGVCLGHQALCAARGAAVTHAPEVVHGKPSTITHDGRELFADLPAGIDVGRYHSLAIEREGLPDRLEETAWTDDESRVVMGVRDRERPHVGVQFHPESILTDAGQQLVTAFCERALGGEWA